MPFRPTIVVFTARRRYVVIPTYVRWQSLILLQGDGCVLVKTKQAILVTIYKAPIQAPEATPVVEALADYLIGVGY